MTGPTGRRLEAAWPKRALAGLALGCLASAAPAAHAFLWESSARAVAPAQGRPAAERAFCSFRAPLCVHAAAGTSEAALLRAVRTAEDAFALYVGLGLPSPMPDGRRGGSTDFDLYLTTGRGSRALVDPTPTTVGFDRAASFAIVDPAPSGPPCALESDVARVTAQAMLLGVDGGVHEGVLAAQSSFLAHTAAPCSALALEAIDRLQLRPDLAIASSPASELAGTMIFPWYLDDAFGTGTPGAVMTALIATSSQLTVDGELFFDNEPDVFDALRQVTLDRQMNLGELLVDYAVARAFMGNRSDGAHMVDVDWLDRVGRVRFEWAVRYPELPRRVAPAFPLEPTGAGYVWLELTGAPSGAELTIVTDWEDTHAFQWAAVRLDEAGREVGRHLFGGKYGEVQAQLSLRDLSGTQSILVVGTHLGNDDRSREYDPDRGAARPSGYTVTFYNR